MLGIIIMDKEKALQMALILSDIAEGCGTMLDSIKLIESGLEDMAEMLREYATSE